MELNMYQESTLDRFERWIHTLSEKRRESEKVVGILRQEGLDTHEASNYPKKTWEAMTAKKDVADECYIDRFDGAGRPIPHVCFKIPTGGGKTLVAGAALERLNIQTGLILWIVPTKRIYIQTKHALNTRSSPIRQRLEHVSGGRVKIMEKDHEFNQYDVDQHLCIMLLSLSALNHDKNKEFLHLNRDAGRYQTFFPDTDDVVGKNNRLEDNPDLELGTTGTIKRSLANVFKMSHPVIILDEAHKAYGTKNGRECAGMINRLNPSMVVELSATPNPGISNLLVNVSGSDLWNEEMIKMPINLDVQSEHDWPHLLTKVHDRLKRLEDDAKTLQFDTRTYIRPIALVRVDRTGDKQLNDMRYTHANRVRDYLMDKLSVPPDHIVIHSTEHPGLNDVKDLMSETTEVRWIITKDALKEGWDCSFAYVLAILDNIKAETTVTQLLGRVLRQPDARRTKIKSLDSCYVYCNNPDTQLMAEHIKKGLSRLGMDNMSGVVRYESAVENNQIIKREPRHYSVFLPLVLYKDDKQWIDLKYEKHILSKVDFAVLDAPDPSNFNPNPQGWTSMIINSDGSMSNDSELKAHVGKTVDLIDFALPLSKIVPNVWQAARIAQEFMHKLHKAGKTETDMYNGRAYLVKVLYDHVAASIDKMAEKIFRNNVKKNKIRFDLKISDRNYKVKTYDVVQGKMLLHNGHPVQRSLFDPVYEDEFDTDLERSFARYLGTKKIVKWWHRVASRQSDGYHLTGWKKDNIYPDFIAMTNESGNKVRLGIYDTKGEQLKDNPDTRYKSDVFNVLEDAFNCGNVTINGNRMRGEFSLVFDDKFEEVLAEP